MISSDHRPHTKYGGRLCFHRDLSVHSGDGVWPLMSGHREGIFHFSEGVSNGEFLY